ncbi:MAG: DUF4340 domain-containing protein [Ignavibacteriae bacterium]|nr:DUF4340 domain-containing protein [Ignavibacteriota bacterium]
MNKSTVILIAVFVLLGALAVFYLMPSEEREASYDTATFSMSLDSASIVKIEITKPEKSVTLENQGGKWYVTSPLKYPANMVNLFPILGGMQKFKVGSLVSSNVDRQKTYQVDSAGTKLSVTDRSGKTVTMIVGKMGPSYEEIYFRKENSNDVYLGSGLSPWSLNQEVREWRDKSIYATMKDSIRRLEFITGTKQYVVEKDSSGWKIGADSVETTTMNSTLSTLSDLKTEDFADTLTKPETEPIHLKVTSMEEVAINFYPQLPDTAKYYVQTSKSPQYFVLSKWSVQNILKSVEKFLISAKGKKK